MNDDVFALRTVVGRFSDTFVGSSAAINCDSAATPVV
jgi:hypothetical protein